MFVQPVGMTRTTKPAGMTRTLEGLVQVRLEEDINETHSLMTERDQAYTDYIGESASKYSNMTQQSPNSALGGGLLGGIGKLFG